MPRAKRALDRFTEPYIEYFHRAAIKYNINVIAGTHLTVEDGRLYNIAFLFHRDGRIDRQAKIHITPSEQRWWGVTGGSRVEVMDTDCGKVAIHVGGDVTYPELTRLADGLEPRRGGKATACRPQGSSAFFRNAIQRYR